LQKMGLADKAQFSISSLCLVPAVFIFYICYGIFFVTNQQLYIEKACKVNLGHNASVCDSLTDFPEIQTESQKLIAAIQGLNGALQSLPTIVVAFFAGPLSDRFSRKPLILVSLGGYFLLNLIYAINAFWFYELKMEYLLFECLQDLTGGDLVFLLGINALLVDTTTTDERTTRMVVIDAFRYSGRAVGVQLAAHIRTQVGWTAIFGLNFLLIVANLLYIGFAVKDKKKPVQDGNFGCWKVTTSLLSSYPSLIFRSRPSSGRPLLVAALLSLAFFYFPAHGQGPLWYLFERLQYGINMVDYAHLSTAWAIRSCLTNLIILPVLLIFLQDTTLVLFALTLTASAWTMTAFGTSFTYLLLVGFLYALNWPIEKISNSIVSKLVAEEEVGTAFSLLAVMAKCIEFVAKPFYGLLYRATVDLFPGTFLFVSTAFLGIVFFIVLFLHFGMAQRRSTAANADDIL